MCQKVLGVFAHPDDETFLAGPLLAKFAEEGAQVRLVCATVAESSQTRDADAVSWGRLIGATRDLGIEQAYGLGYAGSLMGCAPDVPNSLVAAAGAEVSGRIAAIIREFQPHIVITDAAYGAYGHPDHIVVHRATVAAVQEVIDDVAKPLKRQGASEKD